jgi:hypothetical protein
MRKGALDTDPVPYLRAIVCNLTRNRHRHLRVVREKIPQAVSEPARELPAMRGISDIRLGFRENYFFGEDFVYLYDELFSSGKMSS